ncbi:uro-adherence factor A isoform X1 [Procambarus clarkii]|uniref:uro-adherence factor A isoform X1 n=2 Tax=Procambarus clarkii TaxID=6728 RepID=UPI00374408D4
MGRRRLCKGTYSKAPVVSETEEEKRARYKQRKVIPRFDDLFLNKNENARLDSSEDFIDTLIKGVKSVDISGDTRLKIGSNRRRKPPAFNSFLGNSTLSVSRISANDTFDKLVGDERVPQTSRVINSPSTSGSSLDFSGILYKSLHANVPARNPKKPRGTKLQSLREVKEVKDTETDVNFGSAALQLDSDHLSFEKECAVSCAKKKLIKSPSLFSSYDYSDVANDEHVQSGDNTNQLTPKKLPLPSTDTKLTESFQLFSSEDELLAITDDEKAAGQPVCRERRHNKKQVTSEMQGRQNLHAKKGRHKKKKDVMAIVTSPSLRYKDAVKENIMPDFSIVNETKKLNSCEIFERKVPKIYVTRLSEAVVKKYLDSVNVSSIENKLRNPSSQSFSNHSDSLTIGCQHSLYQKQTCRISEKSHGSQHSGKSSVKSDMCTSTPADSSRHKTVLSFPTSSDENILSPVPKESGNFTLESSVFDSPLVLAENDSDHSSSSVSKYETCKSSNTCGVSDNISCETQNNKPQGSCYNSSNQISREPFKSVLIPAFNLRGLKTESSSVKVCQEVHVADLSKAIAVEKMREINIEESVKLVTLKKRKRENKRLVKRLNSRTDFSAAENSVILVTKRERDTINLNYILPGKTRKSSAVALKSNFEFSPISYSHSKKKTLESVCQIRGSTDDDQSIILRRRSRATLGREKQLFVVPSPALPKRRISKRIYRRLNNSAQNAKSSNCSLRLSDNEHSSFLTVKPGLECSANANLSAAELSIILTRKRVSRHLSKRESTISVNVTTGEEDSQYLPQLTVSQRMSCKGYVTTRRNVNKGKKVERVFNISKLSANSRKVGFNCSRISTSSYGSLLKSSLIDNFKKRRKSMADQFVYRKGRYSKDSCSSNSYEECSSNSYEECNSTKVDTENVLFSGNEALTKDGDVSITSDLLLPESCALMSSECQEASSVKEDLERPENLTEIKEGIALLGCKRAASQGFEVSRESTRNSGKAKAESRDFMHLPPFLSSTNELEDYVLLPICTIPMKPGKGWRRPFSSIVVPEASHNAVGQSDDIRRQTVHCMSNRLRRSSVLRMSSNPSEISHRINQMGANPREIHNRSKTKLQISLITENDSTEANLISINPRDHVLVLCDQEEPLPLTDCFTASRLACCKKIGEGVYGEVFMTQPNPTSLEGATVMKIMPIEGNIDVNGEPQKKFHEILSEIVISLELSNLREADNEKNWCENFVHVLKCWCVQGSYHQDLLCLWDEFHEKKESDNDRPDIFLEDQLYIVLEFGHGGGDLESFVFNNARDALAIFLQIAYSLAVAEQELEFEHRDLHWGNVLVAQTKETSINFKLNGECYTLQTNGVKATVIDFTLSRMKLPHCVVFNNLAEDPSLFAGEGDYQFEIYRQMMKANKNEWEAFTPYTNVLWLHYILEKMTSDCYFKNVKSKVHKSNYEQLIKFKQQMLNYDSAMDFVLKREQYM